MGREDGSLTRGGGTGAGDRARILDACRRESQADLLTGKVAGRARGGAATGGLAGAAGRAARGSRTAGDVGGGVLNLTGFWALQSEQLWSWGRGCRREEAAGSRPRRAGAAVAKREARGPRSLGASGSPGGPSTLGERF